MIPNGYHVLDGEIFSRLAPWALVPPVTIQRLWSTWNLKDLAWNFDQSNYLYAFSVEVVCGVAVREIELSETNIRIIRKSFFFIEHPRLIVGKIQFWIKLNMYTTLLFLLKDYIKRRQPDPQFFFPNNVSVVYPSLNKTHFIKHLHSSAMHYGWPLWRNLTCISTLT